MNCTESSKPTDMDVDIVSGELMTARATSLQNEINQLKLKLVKARAQHESLGGSYHKDEGLFVSDELDRLSRLTKDRTHAFLSYTTLQQALQGSQAVKALKAGLQLLEQPDQATGGDASSEELTLEPEEREYVLELVDEEKELSKTLLDKSQTCLQQEVDIVKMRKDHADDLCKISDLYSRIQGNVGSKSLEKDEILNKMLKQEEARCNQIRFIIQRLMIGEKDMAQIFDKQTNEKFKEMFCKCGQNPVELRKEKMKMNLAPQAS